MSQLLRGPALSCLAAEEVLAPLTAGASSPRLITYPDGTMDLFCPSGKAAEDSVGQAKALLQHRGLEVGPREVALDCGSYYPVAPALPPDLGFAPALSALQALTGAPFEGYDVLLAMALKDRVLPLSMRTGSYPR